ncbi:MAG: GTPase HflX, partial [Acidobacteriota bacterium]
MFLPPTASAVMAARRWEEEIRGQRGILLGAVVLENSTRAASEEHLEELALLARTAGYEVRGRVLQDRGRPRAATLLGKGKVAEIHRLLHKSEAKGLILDNDLSPRQAALLARNLDTTVTDRAGLIHEIFSSRARSREARTQVELASLRYLLPRLAGRWTHFSRQSGGIGLRGGSGEAQIEVDRRLIRKRIACLEKDLIRIRRQREVRRRGRRGVFSIALVGYTNSGKSTLFNALAGARSSVENHLFATLDPLRRRLRGESMRDVVLTDTVGFIRRLPHHLVASFRSTLEEAADAHLLLQVVDLSDAHLQEKMHTTSAVL